MLAATGFLTIAAFLVAVLSQRVSVFIALTVLPILAAFVVGAGGRLGELILGGFETVAPVAIMITFAVLYFCLMIDAGLFDPAVRRVVRWAGGDPLKITVGTAVLTLLVALDGDGASTFLITVSAMLPIYQRIGMRPIVLTAVVCLGAGVMNMIPWGGPTARAMAALDLGSGDVFVPVLPAMAAGILWVLVAAFLIGRAERKRIGTVTEPGAPGDAVPGGSVLADSAPGDSVPADRPGAAHAPVDRGTTADRVRFWLNVALTLALVVVLLAQLAELPVVFVVAFVLALLVNRPGWEAQKDLFTRHGHSVVLVTTMIFAAGVFTGVLGGTGMIEAMARALVGLVPDGAGGALPTLVAVTSMPLSLVFTPDAYYFGVLPVLAETTATLGGDPAEVARAAILGQMTTGFPLSPLTASTFILVGMAGVQLGAHQRFVFGWAFGTTLVMTVVALVTGAIV
ncbi:CitMHS family transporter [Pseudonocardia cypriaca]|uniref:CitMHS family citrate-Mg2+:H+ or citrate-Ca2+:H+ symporter n=1 Tax=Pseudonocardia cypriaca TaxID=882449 RepID=A0A543GHL0_9PSEU|nr:citrate:proton symporter [Pseudonocardia cypriaca]TQM45568.1 CitMHS family citrate-Mg2+:H+ or citrate-Ca2+:H+ symporter [Pseudonocardia cypriaca]